MQPPIHSFASDVTLPKYNAERAVGDDLLCFVFKRYKYITLVFRPRLSKQPLHSYTIHQADVRRLIEALAIAANSGAADYTFLNRLIGGCEGFNDGGPPDKEQLLEFMPAEEHDRLVAEAAAKQKSQVPPSATEIAKPWWKLW